MKEEAGEVVLYDKDLPVRSMVRLEPEEVDLWFVLEALGQGEESDYVHNKEEFLCMLGEWRAGKETDFQGARWDRA